MPVKRSRAGSSSSCVEASVAIAAGGSVNVVKMKDAAPNPPLQPPSFMTAALPAKAGEPEYAKMGAFLERCHYCRKRIPKNSEVYMYRDLCAFCSTDCRDSQIALDQSAKKTP